MKEGRSSLCAFRASPSFTFSALHSQKGSKRPKLAANCESQVRRHGFELQETGDPSDLGKVVQLFLDGGFARDLTITPASQGDYYTWTDLLLLDAYKELQDCTENPFLSCPLNLCLYYLADRHGKVMKLHEKTFDMQRRLTISRWELVEKDAIAHEGFDPLVIENARLLRLAEERAEHLAKAQLELQRNAGRLVAAKENAERQSRLLEKQAEHLVEAREAALQAARLKSEFLARMSHEIRTPMNGVIGMADLLANTPLSEEQRYYTETIVSSGEALLRIVNDVLDLSKIDAGKMELQVVDFDLREVIESTIAVLAPAASRKGLELAAVADPALNRRVLGDPGRLRQVLLNLLGNAVKFTDCGEVLLQADLVQHKGDAHQVRFSISDTGIGISPEDQKRLFEPFSQLEFKPKAAGTGLGLTISKHLVGLMDGEIWVQSKQGAGSTFGFTAQLGTHLRPPARIYHSFQGARALLIAGSPAHRGIIRQQLENCGLRASAAGFQEAPQVTHAAAGAGDPFGIIVVDAQQAESLDAIQRAVAGAASSSPAVFVLLRPLNQPFVPAIASAHIIQKPVQESALERLLVRLSAGQVERSSLPPAIAPGFASPAHARGSLESAAHPLRILVVEDNPINQRVATKILEMLGYRADIACNGREGVEAHLQNPYDIIFMDCLMPEMDGLEASAEIRRRESGAKPCTIIAMTANVLDGDRARCLAAGMDSYLAKPLRPADMLACLRSWALPSWPGSESAQPDAFNRI
jgi:signal transduction histidine kinase/CheY-like chemotaxis protein